MCTVTVDNIDHLVSSSLDSFKKKRGTFLNGLMPKHLRMTCFGSKAFQSPYPNELLNPSCQPTSFQISIQTSQPPLIGPLLPRYSTCSRDWAISKPVRIRCQWYQGISRRLLNVFISYSYFKTCLVPVILSVVFAERSSIFIKYLSFLWLLQFNQNGSKHPFYNLDSWLSLLWNWTVTKTKSLKVTKLKCGILNCSISTRCLFVW